jgi:hypothetical protein
MFKISGYIGSDQPEKIQREVGNISTQAIGLEIEYNITPEKIKREHVEYKMHPVRMNKPAGYKTVKLVISFYPIRPHDGFR